VSGPNPAGCVLLRRQLRFHFLRNCFLHLGVSATAPEAAAGPGSPPPPLGCRIPRHGVRIGVSPSRIRPLQLLRDQIIRSASSRAQHTPDKDSNHPP